MATNLTRQDKTFGNLSQYPWLILIMGTLLALFLTGITMLLLMSPTFREMATLIGTLAITSAVSLGMGFVLYRLGWARSASISFTLVLTYGWAALLTLFNVWIMARLMFINAHDLTLAGVLLLFAAIIATSFGISVAANITDGLRQLSRVANRLAEGDLSARAKITGRDEVSHLATSFNSMAEQLQRAADEREELETLRRELIAWTSHDLRTPLTSIRVMAEALKDGVVSDEVTKERYYQSILGEVKALSDLIDDLFELAQLEVNGLQLKFEAESLSDLISDTLESFKPLVKKQGVTLEGSVGSDLDPVIMNSSKIGRVLSNLVDNAIKYTARGGSIFVLAERTSMGIEVKVQDEGVGFSAEELPRVFERFFRGEQARSRATGGAGLGLAIARGIVEAHGGTIWANNRPSGGAEVGFILPDNKAYTSD